MKLFTYYHTIKYLKFSQIYYRILRKLRQPKLSKPIANRSSLEGVWVNQELYSQKLYENFTVEFLNCKGKVVRPQDWNSPGKDKLWLYNLHYFDELNSFGSQSRKELQKYWVNKWIDENPAIKGGNGWEPYTLSLRIVNWIKAFLSGFETNEKFLNSLAQQADFLSQYLEKHLLGNHYFVNLKALLFAGYFFKGTESDKWLAIGLKDFEKEIKEQVLSDGGNFELTPMYHSIMLTDLLDIANLFKAFPNRVSENIVNLVGQSIVKMLSWLDIMNHGDDKVSFFNDSAFGIAPESSVIREYSSKLDFSISKLEISEDKLLAHNLQNSGYVSVKTTDMNLIADLAPIGARYIPGHAHADTLSFELSLGESRVFVNSGTSQYGVSEERLRQRSTAAHNTVVINHANSSKVWSDFRVAKRADIVNRKVGKVISGQVVEFSAAHNGYKKQGINCIHHRSWKVSLGECEIKDFIQGDFSSANGYLHLHPSIIIISSDRSKCTLQSISHEIILEVFGADLNIEGSTWHPEFGVVIPSRKISLHYQESSIVYQISWKKC